VGWCAVNNHERHDKHRVLSSYLLFDCCLSCFRYIAAGPSKRPCQNLHPPAKVIPQGHYSTPCPSRRIH
jgi:hypothetical protein